MQGMTAEQILLVQATWAEIEPMADKLGERFYTKLFERMPEVQPLFSSDAREQGAALMSMMGIAVNMLDRLDSIGPTMRTLGKQHNRRRVKPEYFPLFRDTLLETLQYILGSAYSLQVGEAWGAMLEMLAAQMGMGGEGHPTGHPGSHLHGG
jgi:hemoglobin-like flavoprotein